MYVKDIYLDIVKHYCKHDNGVFIGEYDESTILVSMDGKVVYLLSLSDFPFNCDRLLGNRRITKGCKRSVVDIYEEKSSPATLTNQMRAHERDIYLAVKNETSTVWINQKFLARFNPREYSFRINKPTDPVLVYESGILSGMIYPFKFKD